MITVAEWLAELRTTDKPQGLGNLCSWVGEYCCLGIGAELAGHEKTKESGGNTLFNGCRVYPQKFLKDLPEEMWRPALHNGSYTIILKDLSITGLTEEAITYEVSRGRNEIGVDVLNDVYHKTFKEIADAVEREYERITGHPVLKGE